jgi:hypothetical protein
VSVVKNGCPMPAAKMTTRPFSMWRMARRRMKRLGDFAHLYRGDDAGEDVQLFERVLQRDGVHHRRQHTHVIGGGAVHAPRARLQPAEDVSPADDQRDFDAKVMHLFDFLSYADNHLGIDPISDLSHKRFAAEFEKNSPEPHLLFT